MEVYISTPSYHQHNYTRLYKLCRGDIISMNNVATVSTFGKKIKKIRVGDKLNTNGLVLMCTGKTKRKWWRIWLPKYIYAQFEVWELSNTND